MIYIFIIACVCVHIFVQYQLGVSLDNPTGCFTYCFQHVNLLHLGINMFSIGYMFRPIKDLFSIRFGYYIQSWLFFIMCYIAAVFAGLICACEIPTVGASGISFYLLGLLIVLKPTKRMLYNYIFVALALIIQLILGKSNVALHVVAFMFGVLTVIIGIVYERTRIHSREQ